MDDGDFYVILPSNSSSKDFPDNKLFNFTVKLSQQLPVNENWVVGLSEIQFTSSYNNVRNGFIKITSSKHSSPIVFNLQDGYYESVEQLVEKITQLLNNSHMDDKLTLHYDKIINKTLLKVYDSQVNFGIGFSENLSNMMGFNQHCSLDNSNDNFYYAGVHRESAADIHEGFNTMFIYTDIVTSQLVGDAYVPLLRAVPFDPTKPRGSLYWITFQNVQYKPVLKTQSDTIEIDIRRDNGKHVPFEGTKVVLTLHFKHKQHAGSI